MRTPPVLLGTGGLSVAALALASSAHAFPQSTHPAMTDPSKATEKAPDSFRAKFETTKGAVVFECTRAWAPNGVDRFYNLVKIGFFDDVALFRAVKGFVVQWGIHGDPKVSAAWQRANIPPDPVKQSNTRGMLTYAMAQRPDTRSTQLFINYGDNKNLDAMGFAPICKVAEGMDIAESFYTGYGEAVTEEQGEIATQGNAYLKAKYPKLDYIKTASVVGETRDPARGSAPPPDEKAPGTEGKSGEDTKKEEPNVTLYVVIGVVAVGAAFFFFTRKQEEPPPPPPKKGKKKSAKKKTASPPDEPKE